MKNNPFPPIKGFIEKSSVHWPGRHCAVLLLPYCNLRCPYCDSHQLVMRPDTLETLPLDDILKKLLQQQDQINSICITGGEPTIHRSLPALLQEIRGKGFKARIDTNGTQPEILGHLIEHNLLDHVAMDVKAPLNDSVYSRCAGVHIPTSIIEASIKVLMAEGLPATFRCTAVPSLLTETEICHMAEDVARIWAQIPSVDGTAPRLIVQGFNPGDPMEPTLKNDLPYDENTLAQIQARVDDMIYQAKRLSSR